MASTMLCFYRPEGGELVWSDNQKARCHTSTVTDRKHDFTHQRQNYFLWVSLCFWDLQYNSSWIYSGYPDWRNIPYCWQIHTYLLQLSLHKPPSSPCGDPSVLLDPEWGRWLGHYKRWERIKEKFFIEKLLILYSFITFTQHVPLYIRDAKMYQNWLK